MEKKNIVVALAGHVDHGKTSLVKCLTGIDTDRLPEEKKRGLSIEPGFAYLETKDYCFDFVDIPGHRNYFANALRSLFGFDLAIMVIASNDGVMPQTIEHLEVLKALGLKKGLTVLTKCDLVDQETLELAETEVKEFIKNSPFENQPVIRFSITQKSGKEEIIAQLEQLAESLNKKPDEKLLRFFIDRAFILKGKGKVVTGLVNSGQLELGEKLMVFPERELAVVREIERHRKKVAKVRGGERAGLNLSTKASLKRGQALGRVEELFSSLIINVNLTALSSSPRPLFNREKVYVYHFSTETTAKIIFLKKEKLNPGESTLAQLRLTSPITPFCGDPVIVRFFIPSTTAASGIIVDTSSIKLRQGNYYYFEKIQDYLSNNCLSDNEKALLIPLTRSYLLTLNELSQQTGFSLKEVGKKIKPLIEKKLVKLIDQNRVISEARLNQAKLILKNKLKEIQKKTSLPPCLTTDELYTRLALPYSIEVFKTLIETFASEFELEFKEGKYWLKNQSLTKKQAQIRSLILEKLSANFPIREAELLSLNSQEEKIISLSLSSLLKEGQIIRFKDGAYISRKGFESAKETIINHLEKQKELTVVEAKNLLGWGRRATISFLEHLDRLRITIRKGDKRELCP